MATENQKASAESEELATEAAKPAAPPAPELHTEPGDLLGVPIGMEANLCSRKWADEQFTLAQNQASDLIGKHSRIAEQARAQLEQVRASAVVSFDPSTWLNWFLTNKTLALGVFGLVQEWDSITQPITDRTGMKSRIVVALKFANLLAQATPGTFDDQMVNLLGQMLSTDGAVDILEALVTAIGPNITTASPGVPNGALAHLEAHFPETHLANLKSRATDRSINWGNLINLLPVIIQIIKMFLPSTPGTAPVALPPAQKPLAITHYRNGLAVYSAELHDSITMPTEVLPILQWASEFPDDAKQLIADFEAIPAMPPFEPAVDSIAACIHVIAGAIDRFPLAAIEQTPGGARGALANYTPKLEAHKLGDGTLLKGLMKWLPTILQLVGVFTGVPIPTPTA